MIWNESWFAKLSADHKLLYFFIRDNSDKKATLRVPDGFEVIPLSKKITLEYAKDFVSKVNDGIERVSLKTIKNDIVFQVADLVKKKQKVWEIMSDEVFNKFPFSEFFLPEWEVWKKYKYEEFGFKYKSSDSELCALEKLKRLAENEQGSDLEMNAKKIITQSMEDGYRGFFPLKEKFKQKSFGRDFKPD